MVELTAGGADDRDGQHAASLLTAYFNVEHARALRQRLWRRLAAGAVLASAVTAMTPLLARSDLVFVLIAFAAAALGAAVAEWRAEGTLRRLIAAAGKSRT